MAEIIVGIPREHRTSVMGPPPQPNRAEHPYKGTINFQGILVYVENEPGSLREGRDSNGQPWRVQMRHYYGEIPRTLGSDNDPVDAYVGNNPIAPMAFILHQRHYFGTEHAVSGAYDEDKVMLGFSTMEEAIEAYAAHFNHPIWTPGVTPMPVSELRQRLEDGLLDLGAAIVKAKYIRRWKGPDGRWKYEYNKPRHQPERKPHPKGESTAVTYRTREEAEARAARAEAEIGVGSLVTGPAFWRTPRGEPKTSTGFGDNARDYEAFKGITKDLFVARTAYPDPGFRAVVLVESRSKDASGDVWMDVNDIMSVEHAEDAVTKARTHKYKRRIPKPGGGYEYIYDEPKAAKPKGPAPVGGLEGLRRIAGVEIDGSKVWTSTGPAHAAALAYLTAHGIPHSEIDAPQRAKSRTGKGKLLWAEDGMIHLTAASPDAAARPRRAPPGSQLPGDVLQQLKDLGVGKLPQADIPLSDIEIKLEPRRGIHDRAVISWRDTAGRRQNAYTPQFHERNAREKWARVMRFRDEAPRLISRFERELKREEPGSLRHQGLMVALIIAKTGLRPGNEGSLQQHGHQGISTLTAANVTIRGSAVSFEYVGKAGKTNTARLQSKAVADALKEYSKGDERLFDPRALAAARALLPEGMKLKDFRTIIATNEAMKALDEVVVPPPLTGNRQKDKRLLKQALREASRKVAERLNNTAAVAETSYIHPMVFEQWTREKVGAPADLWT